MTRASQARISSSSNCSGFAVPPFDAFDAR